MILLPGNCNLLLVVGDVLLVIGELPLHFYVIFFLFIYFNCVCKLLAAIAPLNVYIYIC